MKIMNLFTWLAVLPVLLCVLWASAFRKSNDMVTLHGKRVCLLIAHPDDEAMFFAPTVLSLTRSNNNIDFRIICLSSGNADGLGSIRKQELIKSARILGVRTENNVTVLDSEKFPDSMQRKWSADEISSELSSLVRGHEPDVLITFDEHGVSSHPNHISLYHGAREYISNQNPTTSGARPLLYTLTTVNIIRKYSAVLDSISIVGASSTSFPRRLFFLNNLQDLQQSRKAMTQAHKSQMVWFRWAWITLSRYMYMNVLVLQED